MNGLSHARGSHALGPTDVPLLDVTIGAALRNAAARWGTRLALVSRHQGLRWTWGEFDAEADRIATGLIARGVQAGDRVGIWAPNCAEWAVIQFATARIGAILVTINPAYRTTEVEYALNKVGCSVLVTATRFKTSDYIGMLREVWPTKVPGLRLVVTLGDAAHQGCLRWADLALPADRAALDAAQAALSPDDAINIQFTSGTTGLPKGATLTHRNILNNGYFSGRTLHLTPDDRICVPVPLYHCFGMVLGNLASVTSGAAVVYPADSFDPEAVLEAVGAEGWRADDVHHAAQPPGAGARGYPHFAHRDHGRIAVPARHHARSHVPAEHGASHHRLWHDRDQPADHPDRNR